MTLRPLPSVLVTSSVLILGLALYACSNKSGGFRQGGQENEPDYPNGGDDTADTRDGDETGADTDTSDTGPSDTADTAAPYVGTGYGRGDTAYNLVAPDQNGDTWRLYQHDEGPVVLVFGYGQSASFQAICNYLGEMEAEFARYDLTIAVMMFLDEYGVDTTRTQAAAWADKYDLSTVLYDPDYAVRNTWAGTTQVKTYVIDSSMVIQWDNLEATAEEQLRSEIESLVY